MMERKRALGSISPRLAILILIFSLLLSNSGPVLSAANSPVTLTVYSENNLSSSITDPYLIPGDSFNVSILASNLPASSVPDSGGISGFDITLDYTSSILKAVGASFAAPQCPLSDKCIFDMPSNDTIVAHLSIDSPAGITRLAVVGLGPGHKPDLSVLHAHPAVLFHLHFAAVGNGPPNIPIH